MSFKDCIQTAIDTGKVTSEKGTQAQEAFDREFERAKTEGLDDGAAVVKAADEAVRSTTTLTANKRWQRINEMQRAHELHTRIMKSNKPWQELQAIMTDLELSQETVRSFAGSYIDSLMMKYKPKAGGLVVPTADMDKIVDACWPTSRAGVDAESVAMADSLQGLTEMLRKEANMYGASIPENKNNFLFQTQDAVKTDAVPENEWVQDHMRELDWSIMERNGKPVPAGERDEYLRYMYQGIVYEGMNRPDSAHAKPPTLGNRLNRDRVLYYKDSAAWKRMQAKYGSGNLYEQTINMIDSMTKDIALLKTFGPSPDTMKEFAKRQAAARVAQMKGGRQMLNKTKRQFSVFDDEYKIFARHVPSADGNWPIQMVSTGRSLASTAMLGKVLIPSMAGDLVNSRTMATLLKIPEMKIFRSYIENFVPTKENIQDAIQSGINYEAGTSLAHSHIRYFSALDGPHWARRFGEITYRSTLTSHHTQIIRNVIGKEVLGALAKFSNTKFDDMPFAAALIEHGITDRDWDRFRATPAHDFQGAKYLRPIDMWQAGSASDKKVAEKFQNFMQLAIRLGVPAPDLRTRVSLGEAVDPNSARGQVLRTLGTLRGFSTAIVFGQLLRIARTPGIMNKAILGVNYGVWTLLAGMVITQLKAVAIYGQNPYSWDDPEFYARSLLNGGTLGILGDLIFNNIGLANSQHGPTSTPLGDYLTKLKKVAVDDPISAVKGKQVHFAKDTMDYLTANVPDFWYTSLLFQRGVKDKILEWSDPAAFARKEQYIRRHKEGMWWDQGQSPTKPDLTTVGGSE